MTVLTKPIEITVPVPVVGVCPTSITDIYKVGADVSSAANSWVAATDTVSVSDWTNDPPDMNFLLFKHAPYGTITLTPSSSTTCTLSNRGKLTFSGALDDTNVDYVQHTLTINGTRSLRSITITNMSRIRYESGGQYNKEVPYVLVNVCDDGSTWVTQCIVELPTNTPVYIGRNLFGDNSYVQLVIRTAEDLATTSNVAWQPEYDKPIIVHCDFANSADNPLMQFGMGAVGAGIGAVSAAGLQQVVKLVEANSTAMDIIGQMGADVTTLVGSYISATAYAVSKKWRTWDDFNFTEIISALADWKGLTGLGVGIGMQAISAFVGAEKGSLLPSIMNAAGGASIGAGSMLAYLTLMAKIERLIYPS